MKTVNALTIRNRFGEVMDYLEKTGEPVLVSKSRKIRAALVPIEEFNKRFIDKQAEEERNKLLACIKSMRRPRTEQAESTSVLRSLRGYED
jgi:prevent-host-death family protein